MKINSRPPIEDLWFNENQCLRLQERWGDYDKFYKKQSKKNILEAIYHVLEPSEKKPVLLDVGCGTGHFIWSVRKKCGEIIALDNSNIMLDLCQKQFNKEDINIPIRYINATCWNIPLNDNEVDISMQIDVCMHIGRSFESIKEMIRVSKHYILFTGPSFEKMNEDKSEKKKTRSSWILNIDFLENQLKKMVEEKKIKKFYYLLRQNNGAYNHKILIIEK